MIKLVKTMGTVVVVSHFRKDGLLRFYIYYAKINIIDVGDPLSLCGMDDIDDSFYEMMVF